MKRTFLIAILLLTIQLVHGQDYKMYLDTNGNSAEFAKASSYIVVKQLADTAWLVQQYDMENSILQSAMFEDKDLKIPNGKSIYYQKLNSYRYNTKKFVKSDTVNYVRSEGEFKNGNKEGWWYDYSNRGKLESKSYYTNGLLNGPYRAYNNDGTTIRLSGTYINNYREGYWQLSDPEGRPVEIDQYRKDKVVNRKLLYKPYTAPKPPDGFDKYIRQSVKSVIPAQNLEQMAVKYAFGFKVTIDGKITDLVPLMGTNKDEPTVKTMIDIIANSPLWKPATVGDEMKSIEDSTVITIEINSGNITTTVISAEKARGAYYYLTH